ncbi:MAG: SRPBCC family protein [bacterium]
MLSRFVKPLLAATVLLFFTASVQAVPTTDDPEAWKGLSKEQIKKVKSGEVVIMDQDTSEGGEDQKRFIRAAMIFDQPIDKAWKLVRQTEMQHRFLPDLKKCELVKRTEKGDRVDFHVEIAMFDIDYRVRHHYDDKNRHLWWHLDENYDNDMKRVDGFWKLYKLDENRTLARYGTKVEVMSFIPDFIMKRLTKSSLPANMKAYYKYVQSGGTYTKPGFEE